jgi:hypothetical protein
LTEKKNVLGQNGDEITPIDGIHLNYIVMHQTSFYLSIEKEPVD